LPANSLSLSAMTQQKNATQNANLSVFLRKI
jgi:hypothetical protein